MDESFLQRDKTLPIGNKAINKIMSRVSLPKL